MTIAEEERLRARSNLLTAMADAASGRRSAADVYADTMTAWRENVLTDGEMAAFGQFLRERR